MLNMCAARRAGCNQVLSQMLPACTAAIFALEFCHVPPLYECACTTVQSPYLLTSGEPPCTSTASLRYAVHWHYAHSAEGTLVYSWHLKSVIDPVQQYYLRVPADSVVSCLLRGAWRQAALNHSASSCRGQLVECDAVPVGGTPFHNKASAGSCHSCRARTCFSCDTPWLWIKCKVSAHMWLLCCS
jgi:hypothetical protein